jgi:membrane associated rhomboid family serine protease
VAIELAAFALVLLAVNLNAGAREALAFLPQRVVIGEFWRVLTYPLVHVSAYHLALDGIAFLFLYAALPFGRAWMRLATVAAVTFTSVAFAWAASPAIATTGLCGLSGPAHGLMVLTGLATAVSPGADRQTRWLSLLTLLGVFAKCGFELKTGQLAWAGLHFGNLGTPIVACHAGGALGGLLVGLATWKK